MPTLTIKVTDLTTPQLRALNASLSSGELISRLGKGLEVALRNHFKARNLASNSESKRAARGMPQYGIWNKIRQTTNFTGINGTVATVAISEPTIRAKVYGLQGMTAQRSTYLAIPLDPRTYGKPARGKPVPGSFKWTSKKTGKSYIAVKEGDGIKVLYRLMTSVTVAADPNALPSDEKVMSVERGVIKRWLAKQGEETPNE